MRKPISLLTIFAVLLAGALTSAAPPPGKGGGNGGGDNAPPTRPDYQPPDPESFPWQMFGQNELNGGQSGFLGPTVGNSSYHYALGDRIGSPAIAPDGRIFAGGGSPDSVAIGLVSAHVDGAVDWYFRCGGTKGTPAIGSNEIAYFIGGTPEYQLDEDGNIVYVDGEPVVRFPDGLRTLIAVDVNAFDPVADVGYQNRLLPDAASIVFVVPLGAEAMGSVTLDEANGRVLVATHGGWLIAISTRTDGTLGTVDFTYDLGADQTGFLQSTPAIDFLYEVYYVASGGSGALHAVDFDGTRRWINTSMTGATTGPAVGLDGTIYVTSNDDGHLWSVSPDGSSNWHTRIRKKGGFANIVTVGFPALDEFYDANDGTLQTTIHVGSSNGLSAVSGSGSIKWTFATDTDLEAAPCVAADGVVYIQPQYEGLYALDPDGMLRWSDPTVGGHHLTPAIGPDGALYVGSTDPLFQNGTMGLWSIAD